MQSLGTRRVGRGERQREGKQSGRASEASSGVDGRAGSPVGEGSLRGVQPSSRLARRASQHRQCHVAGAASSSLAASDSSLPAGRGFFNHAGGFSGAQPRTATRAQEVAAMLDETLGFYVKATGKDESLMREQFARMKLESLRKERDHWRTHAEANQRLQYKKKEAWELFQRQPRLGAARREEIEREYKQKAQKYSPFGFSSADEKSLQAWVEDLLKTALAEDRKKEARGRRSMGREDSNSKTSSMGEDVGSASPRLVAVSCCWKLSRDVRLDVELVALVSVETTLFSNSTWSMPQRQFTECIMESHGNDAFRFARRREDALRNRHTGQQWNRTVPDFFDVYTTPSMTVNTGA